MIATVIPEAFGPDVRVRLIEDGFGFGNTVIGLKEVAGEYRIFSARSLWLWEYTIEGQAQRKKLDIRDDGYLEKFEDVKVERCEIGVDAALGRRIIEV